MNSMTGFGRGAAAVAGRRVVVEIRSVNHRNLDLKIRGRDLDAEAEHELARAVRASLVRGSVVVTVDEESDAGSFELDRERLVGLHRVLDEARQGLGISAPVDLATLALFLERAGDRAGAGRRAALSWAAVEPAAAAALQSLGVMRAREGEALAQDLRARVESLRATVGSMRAATAGLAERASRRLQERVTALLGGGTLESGRVAQEAALLADRLDVTEERVRLEAHLTTLGGWLSGRAPDAAGQGGGSGIGRKIDFLCQEIARELSTIAAKSQDVETSALVVEAKAELEKIREQAQNVE